MQGEDTAASRLSAQVLELLTENEIHRVYVVAPGGPPHAQAAVTPTDIMRLFASVW